MQWIQSKLQILRLNPTVQYVCACVSVHTYCVNIKVITQFGYCTLYKSDNVLILFLCLTLLDDVNLVLQDNDVS